MQAADAGHAIQRLQELVTTGPGENTAALQEALSIFSRLGGVGSSPYLLERLAATKSSFETWLSEKCGAQGCDPRTTRAILLTDIEKLRKALARGATGQD
ncbi:MAG: hypothetical protein ABIP38_06645 [Steroidobacteraceae bacterium]